MGADGFAKRLDEVRQRFAARLLDRIAEIDGALPQLTGEGGVALTAVSTAHRQLHDLCGAGPTLGFHATGKAARACEQILLQPARMKRGLTQQEMAQLSESLAGLQAAARIDMQSTSIVPE
jgi:HPt (histidine-containing phosphotransfer) domain-containing protein